MGTHKQLKETNEYTKYKPRLNTQAEDRCTQFQIIVVTDLPTYPHTHPPTNRQDRLQYTVPQLARSVLTYTRYCNTTPH